MSELDQEQVGSTADEAHDDPANLDDEIELIPTPTEAETLKTMMRSFLKMFTMDKGYLTMNMMNKPNWADENNIWTYVFKEMPPPNFDTVFAIFDFIDKKMKAINWTETNHKALTEAVFEPPKIVNKILQAMCQITDVQYRSEEREIDFLKLIEQLASVGIEGSKFIIEKVQLNKKMTDINDESLETIAQIKEIVEMVRCKIGSVREGVELVRNYSNLIPKWVATINELVIREDQAIALNKILKVAGYTVNIGLLDEDKLVAMMDSLKENDGKVTLFQSKHKVKITDMPKLLVMMKGIGNNIETIESWTNPATRQPLAPQPAPQQPDIQRTQYLPRRQESPQPDASSRKLLQRFSFQFKSLLRIIDSSGGMDSAVTDQAESMFKTLETMRQALDRFPDVDAENINIEGVNHNVNEKMEQWVKEIYAAKDRNRKKEKKEEKIKTEKCKRLIQMSTCFPTKMEDEASVLGFLCHMLKMVPLLPDDDDFDSLDESALVSNVKTNIRRQEDIQNTSKYETLAEIIGYFQRMYLSNPCFLRTALLPIYNLKSPMSYTDSIHNINFVQNLLTSVQTAELMDQISGDDYTEMTRKTILNKRIDIYVNA